MRNSIFLAALPLVLAACGQQSEKSAPDAQETAIPVEPDGGIGDGATPLPGASPSGSPAGSADAKGDDIPGVLQGRWGMVPADCTSTRGDAKGLLAVGPRTLMFYESVGTLELETGRSESMIRGQFEFTGEGMTWTRDLSLLVQDGGQTLVRREFGADAASGAFTYTRCS